MKGNISERICQVLNISVNDLLGVYENKVVENGDLLAEQEIRNNMIAEPLVIEFGEDVVPCMIAGLKTNYVNQKRKELVERKGILMPVLRMKDNLCLKKNLYRILSYDKVLVEESVEVFDETVYKEIINNMKELYPGVVEGLVPERISYLQIERKLQDILRKGDSIRDMIHILEEMEEGIYLPPKGEIHESNRIPISLGRQF